MRKIILFSIAALLNASAAKAEGKYLFDLLRMPTYSAAFHKMVAPITAREKWLAAKIPTGPGGESRNVIVGGKAQELVDTCKQHDCGDNRMFILFSDGGASAVGILRQPRGDTFLGNPDSAQKAALLNAAR